VKLYTVIRQRTVESEDFRVVRCSMCNSSGVSATLVVSPRARSGHWLTPSIRCTTTVACEQVGNRSEIESVDVDSGLRILEATRGTSSVGRFSIQGSRGGLGHGRRPRERTEIRS